MHTTGACRARFGPIPAFATPSGDACGTYSEGPLNTFRFGNGGQTSVSGTRTSMGMAGAPPPVDR